MRRIKRVWIDRNGTGDGYGAEIGIGGITDIKETFKNGEMARIKYYEVYRKDQLVLELHDFSVVEYFTENP